MIRKEQDNILSKLMKNKDEDTKKEVKGRSGTGGGGNKPSPGKDVK